MEKIYVQFKLNIDFEFTYLKVSKLRKKVIFKQVVL